QQHLLGPVRPGEIDYSQVVTLDLATVVPNVAGPKRPQDRIALTNLKSKFESLLTAPVSEGGYGKAKGETRKADGETHRTADGDVVIAAITSCTNTSNPGVMLAAGLVAKNAAARGLKVKPWVKTSLAPGSRVVTEYLAAADLQRPLDQLGFALVGYSCTTCMG